MSTLTLKNWFIQKQAQIEAERSAEFEALASGLRESICDVCGQPFTKDYRDLDICSECEKDQDDEDRLKDKQNHND